ncbi:FAD-binding protein [Streptomyces abyssalis]|uniref:FAD-binding protein n=1 Tax=Streptomyces abyssalis TaxID=933944 RepID=A0A1E7JVK9_9ACTN|nr:FAD-binding oxidoreductase [Streptomyces abyssalis]OEU94515.1 FAD-binding protein [Streptomyces abyssalis]OEU95898.1 FAD-binding protein [Streptomyces abyssalis]OEV27641.1 FAD-binding protein [Streptomyces nanshensis]
MSSRMLHDSTLTGLRTGFTGTLLTPGDPSYEETRAVFNAMIDRSPALIALPHNEAEVARAVAYGRAEGLPIAVRGGGHSVAGNSTCDGLVVDLREMNGVTVDPAARTVRVGGGATMRDLDTAVQPYGLATTGGRVSTTGVGGFVLGGGSGWLERAFGLACDNLLAAELVTADGSLVRATAHSDSELFWALHGGGGNFGVVTSMTLRLHPLPVLTAALLIWPEEATPQVVREYRDFMENAPDQVGGGLICLTAGQESFVPEDLAGRLACAVLITYTGPESQARDVMAPMLRLGHAGEMIAEMPYAELQSMLDDPPGYRNYWSAEHLDAFPDEAVDLFCARAHDMVVPSPSQHVLFPQGGAVARDAGLYPLPWRSAPWTVHPFGLWDDPADDARAKEWARGLRSDLQPWASGAVYLNFIGQEGQDRIVAGFGPENYERLAAVKAYFDPENVFRLNHNIQPAA